MKTQSRLMRQVATTNFAPRSLAEIREAEAKAAAEAKKNPYVRVERKEKAAKAVSFADRLRESRHRRLNDPSL